MNLILFGFKNCGKTYFGKLLAEELNLPYIDTDVLIENLSGMPCQKLYSMVGAEVFRQTESEALATLQSISDTIIGVGGGAVIDKKNVNLLKKIGRLVYLKADKDLLKKRTLNQYVLPAYIDPENKEGSFEAMYQKRLPIYEGIQTYQISLSDKSNEAVIKELKEIYYGK
jgi:shikimate kinase